MPDAIIASDDSTVIDLAGLPAPIVQSIRQLIGIYKNVPSPLQAPSHPRPPLAGRFADSGLSFSKEEIDEMQTQLWGAFPRPAPPPEAK